MQAPVLSSTITHNSAEAVVVVGGAGARGAGAGGVGVGATNAAGAVGRRGASSLEQPARATIPRRTTPNFMANLPRRESRSNIHRRIGVVDNAACALQSSFRAWTCGTRGSGWRLIKSMSRRLKRVLR